MTEFSYLHYHVHIFTIALPLNFGSVLLITQIERYPIAQGLLSRRIPILVFIKISHCVIKHGTPSHCRHFSSWSQLPVQSPKTSKEGRKSRHTSEIRTRSVLGREETPRNIKEDKRRWNSVSFIIHAANFSLCRAGYVIALSGKSLNNSHPALATKLGPFYIEAHPSRRGCLCRGCDYFRLSNFSY